MPSQPPQTPKPGGPPFDPTGNPFPPADPPPQPVVQSVPVPETSTAIPGPEVDDL